MFSRLFVDSWHYREWCCAAWGREVGQPPPFLKGNWGRLRLCYPLLPALFIVTARIEMSECVSIMVDKNISDLFKFAMSPRTVDGSGRLLGCVCVRHRKGG